MLVALAAYHDCDGPEGTQCAYIYFDVNGKKGPNKEGQDVFGFNVLNNRITTTLSSSNCSDSSSVTEVIYGCATKILEEGAKNY